MTDPRNPGPSGWQPGYPPGPAQPGQGAGTYPPGPAQPGGQPGAYPPGPAQPSAPTSGGYAPGSYGPGPGQPGSYPPGPGQPGVQPGAYAPGVAPPAAQPGDDAPGTSGKQTRTGSSLALGIGIGFVTAFVVAGALLLTHVLRWGSSTQAAEAADTRPITMPDKVGDLTDYLQAMQQRGAKSDSIERFKTQLANTTERTVQAYQQAYGGAAVAFRQYADSDLLTQASVIVVRAPSPGLTIGPIGDPADLGLAVNQRELAQVGDVQCMIVHTQTVPAGQTPDPADDLTVTCQKSGPSLTVQVTGGNFKGNEGRTALARVTTDAYQAVNGG